MGSPETCPACWHPSHVGACDRRIGATAYDCGCLRDTPPAPPAYLAPDSPEVDALAKSLCEDGPIRVPWGRAPEWQRMAHRTQAKVALAFLSKRTPAPAASAAPTWSGVGLTWWAFGSALVVFLLVLAVGAGVVAAIVLAQVAWAVSGIVDGIRDATDRRRSP